MKRAALILLLAATASAAEPAAVPPRRAYNEALKQLDANDLDAAEKSLLAARDGAGADDELRFRAAFNLGVTYARRAEGLGDKADEALAALRQSAAWFRDAARLRPKDDDARANLETVLLRAQALADKLNQGQNKLEARLGRAIEDQRGLRGRVQELMARVDAAHAAAEPLAFQEEFRDREAEERQLVADVNAASDLLADEESKLEGTPEKERKDEDKVRLVQLEAAEPYLEAARVAMADTRRLLLRLQGASAHRKADAALLSLKRAREQLADPIAVLRAVAEDEVGLLEHTAALDKLDKGEFKVAEGAPQPKAPPWLTPELLGDRQGDALERTAELAARFRAAGEQANQPPPQGQQPSADEAKTKRMLEAAAEAAPRVAAAQQAMVLAKQELAARDLATAQQSERTAIHALSQALEEFADLRSLIEVTYADQREVVKLLSPDAPDAEKLDTKERGARIADLTDKNRKRLEKLAGLIADEAAAAKEPEKEKPFFEQAEGERKAAAAAVETLAGAPALPAAKEAETHVENLRRLFFSIVEHLQELAAAQEKTYDGTGTAQGAVDDDEKQKQLGPLADPQKKHAATAAALAQALEEQADQAAKQPPQQGQAGGGADAAQKLAAAATETRAAQTAMEQASQLIGEAQAKAGTASVDLAPTLEQQKQGLEHVIAAIRILQPPEQQQQQQQQDQQQQQQQQQQKQEQQLSKEEAARRLQEVRDREAAREKDKQQRQKTRNEPVEKDW